LVKELRILQVVFRYFNKIKFEELIDLLIILDYGVLTLFPENGVEKIIFNSIYESGAAFAGHCMSSFNFHVLTTFEFIPKQVSF
jgi:hypothetical protein